MFKLEDSTNLEEFLVENEFFKQSHISYYTKVINNRKKINWESNIYIPAKSRDIHILTDGGHMYNTFKWLYINIKNGKIKWEDDEDDFQWVFKRT